MWIFESLFKSIIFVRGGNLGMERRGKDEGERKIYKIGFKIDFNLILTQRVI